MLRLCHKGSGKLTFYFYFYAASQIFQQRLLYSYKEDKALVLEILKKKTCHANPAVGDCRLLSVRDIWKNSYVFVSNTA